MIAIRILVCLLLAGGLVVANDELGILGQKAPGWDAKHWRNVPDDARSLDVSDYKGKVLYLYFFQSWCPGCHAHGFPTLKTLSETFADDEAVAFVAVQTVFEGFLSNTPKRALESLERHELKVPVGHSGSKGKRSGMMRDYRSGGTPWTVIVDKAGVVRFNGFHITAEDAARLMTSLK